MDDDTDQPMGQLSAHLDRGWDLASRGDLTGAMVSAIKALELSEGSPEAHNLAGYILQQEGRLDEALEHYEASLEIDDLYVDAMLNAADLLVHAAGRPEEGLEYVRDALELLEPDEVDELTDARLLELDVHLARGDEEAARKVALDLPEGPFETPGLDLSVAAALIDADAHDRAEPLLRRALERGPNADAHYFLGLVREAKDEQQTATMEFLVSRELDAHQPSWPWTLPRDQFERCVQAALEALPPETREALSGAMVVITALPGAEVVADGIDPRVPVLLDPGTDAASMRVERLYVYQRNVERAAVGMLEVEAEVARAVIFDLQAVLGGADADPK